MFPRDMKYMNKIQRTEVRLEELWPRTRLRRIKKLKAVWLNWISSLTGSLIEFFIQLNHLRRNPHQLGIPKKSVTRLPSLISISAFLTHYRFSQRSARTYANVMWQNWMVITAKCKLYQRCYCTSLSAITRTLIGIYIALIFVPKREYR